MRGNVDAKYIEQAEWLVDNGYPIPQRYQKNIIDFAEYLQMVDERENKKRTLDKG